MELGIKGKTCIVTGASRGIGLDIATVLAEEGADVAMIARDGAAMEQAAAALRRFGVRVFAVAADLATPEGVSGGIRAALEKLGRVDILINNAGSSTIGSFDQVSDAQWVSGMAVKPLGYVRACREIIPHMRANRAGRIVNVAGGGGRWATAEYVMGCLNAATLHFTKALAEELGPYGISVVAVNPGPTGPTARTDAAFAAWGAKTGTDPKLVEEKYLSGLPLRRMATTCNGAGMVPQPGQRNVQAGRLQIDRGPVGLRAGDIREQPLLRRLPRAGHAGSEIFRRNPMDARQHARQIAGKVRIRLGHVHRIAGVMAFDFGHHNEPAAQHIASGLQGKWLRYGDAGFMQLPQNLIFIHHGRDDHGVGPVHAQYHGRG